LALPKKLFRQIREKCVDHRHDEQSKKCARQHAANHGHAHRTAALRTGTEADFRNFLKLAQFFNCIDFISGYPVEPIDLHPAVRHLDALHAMAVMTDKPYHAYSLGKERITDVALGDQVQRVMTVLFADIRDFTRLAETMTPAETFRFVNQYLGAIQPAVAGHGGVVDKFVGDAVMALFPERPDEALRAALEMFRRLETFNEARAANGDPPVAIGVGIHTGSLMLGTIGGRERMDTTVISDAVNIASRVENLTKAYRLPLIITEETAGALHDRPAMALRRIDRVLGQGKSQPVVLYEVMEADAPERRAAKLRALPAFEAGRASYEAGDLAAAAGHFERALEIAPADSVAQVLLERARRLGSDASPAPQGDAPRVEKA
jgi:class 3 adenylate cyclase